MAGAALLGCPECDLPQRAIPLQAGESALCGRCGATLYRRPARPEWALPLTLAGLIAFGVAIAFPIVGLELKGDAFQATLVGAAQALYEDGMAPLAALVVATTTIFPFLVLATMVLLLSKRGTRHAPTLLNALRAAQPWAMVEVFVLGVLVAFAKLAHMAKAAPGVAAWALGALVVLLAAAASAFDPPRPHFRKPHSLSRTWAFLAAAIVLYIPANVLPVMHTEWLGGAQDDTIISGVVYLWRSGSWPLALVVFVASISVPLLKIMVLGFLAGSIQLGMTWRPRTRARLYRMVELIGRWSMLDIYVIAILVALVHVQGLATIHARPGALAFAAVVVLTILAAMSFDPRLIWGAQDHGSR